MSTLLEVVRRRIEEEGLTVEDDRGGLLVRGGGQDQAVSVWVDETDRVVRAEEVITYPVDDFSPALGEALDLLNQARVGVVYGYQDSQRAVVAASVWSSPSRDISQSQLHLLLALLAEARARDGAVLLRVAEGDAGPRDVLDEDDGNKLRLATSRFSQAVTSRYDVFSDPQDAPPPRRATDTWAEPPTRPLGKISEVQYGAYDEAEEERPPADYAPPGGGDWEADPAWDDALAARAEGGPPPEPAPTRERRARATTRKHETEPAEAAAPGGDDPRPRGTGRYAFQRAISEMDRREHTPVDLTVGRRSLKWRALKSIALLLVGGAVAVVLFDRIVRPLVPGLPTFDVDVGSWFAAATQSEEERELARREALGPGPELLVLELEEPLPNQSFLQACLSALGPDARGPIERVIVSGATEDARVRAYKAWSAAGFDGSPEGRLALARALQAVNRPGDKVLGLLLAGIDRDPPPDPAVIAALEGLPHGPLWRELVERLGRAGEGAEERAKALSTLLERDTPDSAALRALIETGHGPDDALVRLVTARGVAWAREEGWALLSALTQKGAGHVAALLAAEGEEARLLGLDLLGAARPAGAAEPVTRLLRDVRQPVRLRIRAAIVLGEIGAPESTWELVLVLNRKDEEPAVHDEVRRALSKLPEGPAVEQLAPHLASDRAGERYYAVRGLAALRGPTALGALIDVLGREPEGRVRVYVLQILEQQQKVPAQQKALAAGLGTFRRLARSDPDERVRAHARRLYMALTGHEP